MKATKQQILTALDAFARQRAGIEFGNYGDVSAFRKEQRSITRDLHDARVLLRAVSWRDSITADDLRKAFSAYSGRLTLTETKDGVKLGYCTGQYFPTEYRKAVCAVLASALWDYTRKSYQSDYDQASEVNKKNWTDTPGYVLREHFKREFGRGLAGRWFNWLPRCIRLTQAERMRGDTY